MRRDADGIKPDCFVYERRGKDYNLPPAFERCLWTIQCIHDRQLYPRRLTEPAGVETCIRPLDGMTVDNRLKTEFLPAGQVIQSSEKHVLPRLHSS